MVYITDGSFEGILTAVFEAYERKEKPISIVSQNCFQLALGLTVREVETSEEKYKRVSKAISRKISPDFLTTLYCAFLSEDPDIGISIYNAIKVGLKIGSETMSYLQHPDIMKIYDMSRKVTKEVHLFLGILRFRKLNNGIFYAKMEPDNNICMLITEHFSKRLLDQPWIIHDAKRNIYALYNTDEVVFTSEQISIKDHNQADNKFEALWKKYFETTAIESRKNPDLQKRFMPRRYWRNLIEKQA
jgi:probable DNA metabolism protein